VNVSVPSLSYLVVVPHLLGLSVIRSLWVNSWFSVVPDKN